MAEHPPLLDTAQILSSDISLLSAPIVSADGTQQVRKLKLLFLYVLYACISFRRVQIFKKKNESSQ